MEAITFLKLVGPGGRPMRVDSSLYEKLEKKLHMISPGSCLFIIFHSNGGDLDWARKASALLHKVAIEKSLTTVGFGYGNVHSSALRIFLMCQYRLGLPSAKYLVHLAKDISFEVNDRNVQLVNDEEINFFATMTGTPYQITKQLFYQEVYLDSSAAHNLGVTNLQDYKRLQKPLIA
jgi:hypothetical protein